LHMTKNTASENCIMKKRDLRDRNRTSSVSSLLTKGRMKLDCYYPRKACQGETL
jgi:hypothetical protein